MAQKTSAYDTVFKILAPRLRPPNAKAMLPLRGKGQGRDPRERGSEKTEETGGHLIHSNGVPQWVPHEPAARSLFDNLDDAPAEPRNTSQGDAPESKERNDGHHHVQRTAPIENQRNTVPPPAAHHQGNPQPRQIIGYRARQTQEQGTQPTPPAH